MEMMTMEEFRKLDKAIEKAKEDDTPYVGIINDEIHVNGDPNNTELKAHDYTVKFAFPKTDRWKEIVKNEYRFEKETENFIVGYKEYENVWVTPRKVGTCVEAFMRVISFYNMITEKGDVEKLTEEQMMSMLSYMNREVEDAIYEAVARVLGIDMAVAEFMTIDSAMYNAVKIVNDHPDIINSADLFFGSPQRNL